MSVDYVFLKSGRVVIKWGCESDTAELMITGHSDITLTREELEGLRKVLATLKNSAGI